ncbi:MAG: hypothetical protein RL196_1524 [Actinomycetota bacterium]|jgi:glycosyltransferase involved in cell wall biosynthesis
MHAQDIDYTPRVAVVHDYLTQRGGAERVVLSILKAFPEADLYTSLFSPEETFPEFRDLDVRTSWLNSVSLFRKNHRLALFLLPSAIESIKIDADLVVVSSSAFAHAVKTDAPVLVYCHTPPRYLYLADEYLGRGIKAQLIKSMVSLVRPALKFFDKKAARRATKYLANSTVVRSRIFDTYQIESDLVFPPTSLERSSDAKSLLLGRLAGTEGNFYILVSRLLPYKNVDKAIEAFRSRQDRSLIVVGSGPMFQQLNENLPENVRLFSNISDSQLNWLYSNAKAIIAPSFEDFGLTVIEAAARGVPAIALRAGGYLDTVAEGITGVFFDEPTQEQISLALEAFECADWNNDAIVEHADLFSEQKFISEMRRQAEKLLYN